MVSCFMFGINDLITIALKHDPVSRQNLNCFIADAQPMLVQFGGKLEKLGFVATDLKRLYFDQQTKGGEVKLGSCSLTMESQAVGISFIYR